MLRKENKQTWSARHMETYSSYTQMFRWTNTQAQAKWLACVGYRIYIAPSLGNSQGKKSTATKYLTPVKLCKKPMSCPLAPGYCQSFSLADSIREQGGQTRKTGSKSSRGGRCVILPPLSGIKCPPSDVRHGPLIKRPPEAKDHCLKRAATGKSPDTKHCHASLTLVLLWNAVKPLGKCIFSTVHIQQILW